MKQLFATALEGVTGFLSSKVALGIGLGVTALLGLSLWITTGRLDRANSLISETRGAVAQVAGVKSVESKNLVTTIRDIGTKMGVLQRERDSYKLTSETQSRSIRALEEETRRAKAEAARATASARQAIRQRDKWIAEAESRSRRTEPMELQREAQQMEDALDALYEAGF